MRTLVSLYRLTPHLGHAGKIWWKMVKPIKKTRHTLGEESPLRSADPGSFGRHERDKTSKVNISTWLPG